MGKTTTIQRVQDFWPSTVVPDMYIINIIYRNAIIIHLRLNCSSWPSCFKLFADFASTISCMKSLVLLLFTQTAVVRCHTFKRYHKPIIPCIFSANFACGSLPGPTTKIWSALSNYGPSRIAEGTRFNSQKCLETQREVGIPVKLIRFHGKNTFGITNIKVNP